MLKAVTDGLHCWKEPSQEIFSWELDNCFLKLQTEMKGLVLPSGLTTFQVSMRFSYTLSTQVGSLLSSKTE